ncbi:unnamed protein product [Closterium sp. NIES-64]|nr:unnamed protein product [Closterium sp. NIES-64]
MPPLADGLASAHPDSLRNPFHQNERTYGDATRSISESPQKARPGNEGIGGVCMAEEGNARWARMMVRCPIWAHTTPPTGSVGNTVTGQEARHINRLAGVGPSGLDSRSATTTPASHAAPSRIAAPAGGNGGCLPLAASVTPSPPGHLPSEGSSSFPRMPAPAASATEAACAEQAQGAVAHGDVAAQSSAGEAARGKATALPLAAAGGLAVVPPRADNVGARLVSPTAPHPAVQHQSSPPQHAALPPPPASPSLLSPSLPGDRLGDRNALDQAAIPLLDVAAAQNRKAQEIAAAVTPGASVSVAARARGGLWSPLGSPAGISPHARLSSSIASQAGYMPSPDWSAGYLTPMMPSPDPRAAFHHRPPQGAQPCAIGAWTAGGAHPSSAGSATSSRGGSQWDDAVARKRSASSGGMVWAEELEAAVSGASGGEGQRIADAVAALRGAMEAEAARRQGALSGKADETGGRQDGNEEQSEVKRGGEDGDGEGEGRELSGGVAAAEGSSTCYGEIGGLGPGRDHGMEHSERGVSCEVGALGNERREESQGGEAQMRDGGQEGAKDRPDDLVREAGGLGAAGGGASAEQSGGVQEHLGVVREVSRESSSARTMLADAGVAELLLQLLDDRVYPAHVVSTACLITLNLALEPSLKRRLGGEGAVAQLLQLLQSREEGVSDAAVAAVSSLLAEEGNRRVAAGMGATGLLAEVVREERKAPRARKDALIGLFNLSIDPHSREAVLLRHDLVPCVLTLLSDPDCSPAHMPAAALLSVMVRMPAVCRVVEGNDGVPVLVQALEDGETAMQGHVVAVLLQLALTITATRQRIFQEGIIPSLVVLAEGSTGRTRDKWCGPCRLIAPVMEWAAKEYEGRMQVYKIDVDACPKLVEKYKVYGLPSVVIFEKGQVVPGGHIEGALTSAKLKGILASTVPALA